MQIIRQIVEITMDIKWQPNSAFESCIKKGHLYLSTPKLCFQISDGISRKENTVFVNQKHFLQALEKQKEKEHLNYIPLHFSLHHLIAKYFAHDVSKLGTQKNDTRHQTVFFSFPVEHVILEGMIDLTLLSSRNLDAEVSFFPSLCWPSRKVTVMMEEATILLVHQKNIFRLEYLT